MEAPDSKDLMFSWESWAIYQIPNQEDFYYGLLHIHKGNPTNISYHNASHWTFRGASNDTGWLCDSCQTSPPKEVLAYINLLRL